jgi:GTPase
MSFTVAIVGRPNVGKSTLFNRLVGRRVALVDDRPGVTRDRREGEGELGDLNFKVVDTAGFEEAPAGSLPARMRAQTQAAIRSADVVLLMIDARSGVTPLDRAFADLVRRAGKSTVVIANKSEGRAGAAGVLEAFALGLGEPVAISAEHGAGTSELYDALRTVLPDGVVRSNGDESRRARRAEADSPVDERVRRAVPAFHRSAGSGGEKKPAAVAEPTTPIRVAVVGRPNSGKSTLVNALLGEERLLTGPEAGITRDAIAVDLHWGGRAFRMHDTAGLRRRAKVEEKLEKLAVADALEAIRFAEVVVLLMDAQKPFEEQDLRIADLVVREGRALVIAMNKWDLVEPRAGAIAKLRQEVAHWLPQVKGVPTVAVSGLRAEGLDQLMRAVVEIHGIWNRRVPTPALNRWLAEAVAAHPPPAVSGRRIRLNYMTQPKARPPSFVLFSSRADAVPEDYRRYLINGLRETFDLPGTPIRLTLREKENPYARRGRR